MGLSAEKRSELLHELFTTEGNGIGLSYLRISIGGSDLDSLIFSYDDLPEGETDTTMTHFNLSFDTLNLIPVLKEILKISPDIHILGSPWSPPLWMKTNQLPKGGSLLPEYHQAYALYFAKYIKFMENEGIPIDAITIQNEPMHPGNTPSLLMLWDQQAEFIKNHLGPLFEKEGITTKILIWDHNADNYEYPINILNDEEARKYIDGSAFHLYGGTIDNLSIVKEKHPDKNLYFTEQWVGGPGDFQGDFSWHLATITIGGLRNWCKSILEWNLSSDPNYEPHTDDGGCTRCLGAITIDKEGNITRNPAYYSIGQASKFIPSGSVRIDSNVIPGLENVAALTPEGKVVVIVQNTGKEQKTFGIEFDGLTSTYTLEAGDACSMVWNK
jgi:glucosylceramidase